MSLAPWSFRDGMGHPFQRGAHHSNALCHPSSHHTTPMSLLDQALGLGLLGDDLTHTGYLRPWRHLPGKHSGVSNITLDKDGFKVNLDVQQFLPEEVTVKVVDNHVVVEGHHEDRLDEHGYISRNFKRRYTLPKEIECDAITSFLSSDGVLTIAAPAKKPLELGDKTGRVVPIIHTQVPAIHHAANGAANGALKTEKTPKK